MTGLAARIRARWFPASLALVTLANVATAVAYHRRAAENASYRLAVRSDPSLEAAISTSSSFYHRRFSQLYEIGDVLGGSVLVVPSDLPLKPALWRMIAQVELREVARAPIPRVLARALQGQSRREPLRLGPLRIWVSRDLELPSARPLQVLESRANGALFVVSEEQLAAIDSDRR